MGVSVFLFLVFLDHRSGIVGIVVRAGWCGGGGGGGGWGGGGLGGGGLGLGGMELRIGSNIIIFFIVYCCFSYSTCTLFFMCIYIVSYICITFLNMLPSIFFSLRKCWRML